MKKRFTAVKYILSLITIVTWLLSINGVINNTVISAVISLAPLLLVTMIFAVDTADQYKYGRRRVFWVNLFITAGLFLIFFVSIIEMIKYIYGITCSGGHWPPVP